MTTAATIPVMTGNLRDYYLASVPEDRRAAFLWEYESQRKDEVIGVLLALILGSFGAHHFYLRRKGLGILYLCFFWTGIPGLIGFIEAFFMVGRVRAFNDFLAASIAAGILQPGATVASPAAPPATHPCAQCGKAAVGNARFCPHCGAAFA